MYNVMFTKKKETIQFAPFMRNQAVISIFCDTLKPMRDNIIQPYLSGFRPKQKSSIDQIFNAFDYFKPSTFLQLCSITLYCNNVFS